MKFTAKRQAIYTQGLPKDGTRAKLIVSGSNAMAIDGGQQSGIVIKNIEVDGSRETLGALPGSGALIDIGGNATGQTVRHVYAHDPRGWSALHVFEGTVMNDVPTCQGATVVHNTIGPAGTHDGPQNPWADGISFACGNGRVQHNVVTDATDGGIVVFGAPGSTISHNKVIAVSRQLFGGINMVDYAPVHGNYSGTTVANNTVIGAGAFIEMGIAMGPAIWGLQSTGPCSRTETSC